MSSIEDLKKGIIYYFSGTGNTLFAGEKIQDCLKKNGISAELKAIDKIDSVQSQGKYDFIIIGTPVYAFYPPKLVIDFVKSLPAVKGKPAILFCTCGGMPGMTLKYIRNLLKKKGYDVIYESSYMFPDNVNFLFGRNLEDEKEMSGKISLAKEKIGEDIKSILSCKRSYVKVNFATVIFSGVINFFFSKFALNNVKWIADNRCIFCGVCEMNCPTKNIVVKKDKRIVRFGKNCCFCTRCYNFCPVKAIQYKKLGKTEKFRRYDWFKDL